MGRRAGIWQRGGKGQWYMTEGSRQIPIGLDKDTAEREFHRRKAEGKQQREAGITLEGLADHFADFLEREREPYTAQWYARFLMSFLSYVGKETSAESVIPHHVSSWLASHPSWGATTRNNAITIVKRVYAWGKREGLIPDDPVKEIEKPRAKRRETFITTEQGRAIIDSVRDPEFRDFLIALRETGCRPIEVYTLTADRVDLSGGTWSVLNKTRRTTGEKFRTIYLNPAMIELSRRLLATHPTGHLFRNTRGEPWNRPNIVQRFIRIKRKTGMGGEAIAYAFRHLYVTDALEKGIPPATVAELVGHKSLDMIMRIYSKLKHRTDHLREAAQMIRPADITPNSV